MPRESQPIVSFKNSTSEAWTPITWHLSFHCVIEMPYGSVAELCELRSLIRYLTAWITVSKLWKSPLHCSTQNTIFHVSITGSTGRSQWPRGLRRWSATACLLRLWVRIPPGGADFCLLWVLSEVCATSWSLVQRNRTDYGASLWVI